MASQKTTQLNEAGNPYKHGPQDWLRQTTGAAAPEGLEPAAPSLLEQAWTGDRGEACSEPRPARPRAAHAVASVGATFSWPVRVYWEDTDAGGIVFYANYLKFFERSRTEWLRSLGIEQQRLRDITGGMFVVSETQVRYLRSARLDDELIVTAGLREAGRASMIIAQEVLLKSEQAAAAPSSPVSGNTLLCQGTIRIGWVDAATLQPRRIPAAIVQSLKS